MIFLLEELAGIAWYSVW